MSEFIDALMKTEPEIFKTEEEKKNNPDTSSMSLQDMKDYFDAMKESMMSEFKKELDSIKAAQNEVEGNADSGDTNNEQIKEE